MSSLVEDDEKIEMFRRAKSFVGDETVVIAGTGSNCTSHTARLSLRAQEAGVDGLLVVSPYYNKTTQEGLLAHYLTVARSVSLPIIIYNVPGRTGMDISPETCAALSNISNIAGIKEASDNIVKITRIQEACKDFSVYTGNDGMIVPAMALGAKGVISVVSNVLPLETMQMMAFCEEGDYDAAASIQVKLQPVIDALFSVPNPMPIKAAMKIIGYDCGTCRLPLCDISNKHKALLEELLR
jgi:4-hydroxy-tetrahydrodipicolinate synthase